MATESNSNEIRITRVYDAPVQAVWDAWTVPEQVAQWWGPRGFTLTSHSKDLRAGGSWRYTMHGPDGVDYPNLALYHEVEPYQRLVYDHGASDDRPPLFRVTVTFTEHDGKTTMEMISTLPTPQAAAEMKKHIKRMGGYATWDRLAEHLGQAATGRPSFVVNRVFDAPIARVFAMWTRAENLVKWLPPSGTTMRFLRPEIAPGKSALFAITGPHGTMHVRAEYLAIEPPGRIVYLQQFVDAAEAPAPAPGAEVWPATLRTTVICTEEGPERTRVTVTTEAHDETTPAELAAFVQERAGMTVGWNGSFDALDALLTALGPTGAGPLFHGTKADLKPGQHIEAGRPSNYGKRKNAAFVYLTATLDAATWGAELAVGNGPGRIYIVEPTGPIEDDPNLTDKKFPGNPTRSYRTRAPLRVIDEVTTWQGHAPEQLQAMRDHLARLAAQGIEAIEE
jgi:uncharacterized protein YndB with AHSA1/START domain